MNNMYVNIGQLVTLSSCLLYPLALSLTLGNQTAPCCTPSNQSSPVLERLLLPPDQLRGSSAETNVPDETQQPMKLCTPTHLSCFSAQNSNVPWQPAKINADLPAMKPSDPVLIKLKLILYYIIQPTVSQAYELCGTTPP